MKISISMHTSLVLWTFLQLSASLGIATESAARVPKRRFNPKQCQNVVTKVQLSRTYTEEAIAPLCNEEMEDGNCEFFSEALALAISHRDFSPKGFCHSIGRAKFCSKIMDKLLESRAVSDLAFGECERAKPEKGIEYCRKIQQMLAFSVKQEDLDTLRACYMTEAYRRQTASRDVETATNENITIGSEKGLNDAGKGQAPAESREAVEKPIAKQPAQLDKFGNGSGNITSPKTMPVVTNLPPSGPLGLPTTLDQFGKGRGNITSPKPTGIITKPIPADIAPAKGNTTMSTATLSEPEPTDTAPTRVQTRDSESPGPSPVIVAPPIPKDLKQVTGRQPALPESPPPGPVIVAPPIPTGLKQVRKSVVAPPGYVLPSAAHMIWPPPDPTDPKKVQKSLVAASVQPATRPAVSSATTRPQQAALKQPKPQPSSQSARQRSVAQATLMTPLMAPAQAIVALFKSAMGSSRTPGQGAAAQSVSVAFAEKNTKLASQRATLGAETVSKATTPDIAENGNVQQRATASQNMMSRQTAGLVQHKVAHAKAVFEKERGKKSDYSGFLSKFVD